ncbi:MAG: hypothetical protein VR70_00485 [Rhodospirillaceae bacterium BRH_c57]|nr:MAG: hypothetical protein VR70_00485 [Rhodospirillaceae bacterium BRH_c57]
MSERAHTVTITDTDESFRCGEGTVVLKAMVTLGYRGVTSGCHGGGCGVCKVRVDEGSYDAAVMSRAHVSEAEERDRVVLACRIKPRSDLRLSVVGGIGKVIARQQKKFGLV